MDGVTTVDGNEVVGTSRPPLSVAGIKEVFFPDNGEIRSFDNNHRILFRRTEDKLEIRECGDILFSPGATSGAETAKAVILANGNVGIGTKTPQSPLDVKGDLHISEGSIYLDTFAKQILFNGAGQIITNDGYHKIAFGMLGTGQINIAAKYDIFLSPGSEGIQQGPTTVFHANGNVGIGIRTPQQALSVAGNVEVSGTASGTTGIFFTGTNNGIYFRDSGEIQSFDNHHRILFRRPENKLELREHGDILFSAGATAGQETASMIISSNGHVGIGTTNPDHLTPYTLSVAGTIYSADHYLGRNGSISFWGGTGKISCHDSQPYETRHSILFRSDESKTEIREAGDIIFSPGATYGEETAKIVMLGSGNVGIGTPAPQSPLTVAGDISLSGSLHLAGEVKVNEVTFAYNGQLRAPRDILFSPGASTGADPAKAMILANGNFGIGMYPQARLAVAGDMDLAGSLHLTGTTNEVAFLDNGQIRSADDKHRILFRRYENKLELREAGDIIFSPGATTGAETAKVVISADGHVGIGTRPARASLTVAGHIELSGSLNFNGATNQIYFADGGQIQSFDNHHSILFRRSEDKLELREHGDIIFSPGATLGVPTAKAVILANGNVGVGTEAPLWKLQVNGSVKATEFFGDGSRLHGLPGVTWADVWAENIDVRTAPVNVAGITVTLPAPLAGCLGYVVVRFEGRCVGPDGDRIMFSATRVSQDTATSYSSLLFNSSRGLDGNFSNTMTYTVPYDIMAPRSAAAESDVHTYYAVVKNVGETGGSGKVSVYGMLTVEYYTRNYGRAFRIP